MSFWGEVRDIQLRHGNQRGEDRTDRSAKRKQTGRLSLLGIVV